MRILFLLLCLALASVACARDHRSATTRETVPAASGKRVHEPVDAPETPEAAPPPAASAEAKKPEPPVASGAVKAPLRGLLSMGAYKFVPYLEEPDNSMDTVRKKKGLLQGVVILATWRDLEKSADSGLTEDNEIDKGLAEVRRYNQENPATPLAVKLRVWGGFWAPDWVIGSTGGPVHVVHVNFRGVKKPRVLGHVWGEAYRARWAHLQALLAAKYDSEPLIHEVAVTSCMMFTAEPFFVDTHPEALKPLRDAGMTDAAYKACLNHIVLDYAPWKTTRFETPLNPFRSTDGRKVEHDERFTLAWMDHCHKAEPSRCAFDNHDLDDKITKDLQTTYDAMKRSGAEVEFQTGPAMPKDLDGTMQMALKTGASSVELYQDYPGFTDMSDADLRKFAKWLENGK